MPVSEYDYYMLHGQLSCGRDLPEKAIRSFRECIRINPESFSAFTALALIHRGRGEFEQALEHLEKAHAIEPRDFKTMLMILYLRSRMQQAGDVTTALENSLLYPVRAACSRWAVNYDKFVKVASPLNKSPKWGSAFTSKALQNFRAKKFTVLRKLIPSPLTTMLYKQYMDYLKNGAMLFQKHMQRYVKNEDPLSALVQHQLCAHVQYLVGSPIVPTYTIGLHYIKGGFIKPHIDRPQNEISMSICIGAHPEKVTWPLYATQNDDEIQYLLQPNDAFLYRGNEIVHYRKELPDGQTVTQLIVGFRSINEAHCNCQ